MPATTQLPGILQGVRGRAAQSQHPGAGLPPASPKVASHVELRISSDLQWLQPHLVEMSGQKPLHSGHEGAGCTAPCSQGCPTTATQGHETFAPAGNGPGLTHGSPHCSELGSQVAMPSSPGLQACHRRQTLLFSVPLEVTLFPGRPAQPSGEHMDTARRTGR